MKNKNKKSKWFTRFAKLMAHVSGKPATFFSAVILIVLWALTGHLFHYNDTWQLVINTSTTIITFLMVFIIQNTQNRDTAALQIKVDELINVIAEANNSLLDLEELEEKELEHIRKKYSKLAREARENMKKAKHLTE
ncbi:MAG: low affinity iron permease family protein [Ignavibacteriaceae bacterium]|jgi:low affinity Fe/Cu permease|nr:low affinity iron permease family protein [Ignavibacteriaceae bacterium]